MFIAHAAVPTRGPKRLRRLSLLALAGLAPMAGLVVAGAPIAAADTGASCSNGTCTVTFAYNGTATTAPGSVTWTVPPGVTTATFTLDGAAGGSEPNYVAGGAGAEVGATGNVTAGDQYTIRVGGAGGNADVLDGEDNPTVGGYGYIGGFTSDPFASNGGFNGGGMGGFGSRYPDVGGGEGNGGGGGGASDVYLGSTAIAVAGGGGGAGGSGLGGMGGIGGGGAHLDGSAGSGGTNLFEGSWGGVAYNTATGGLGGEGGVAGVTSSGQGGYFGADLGGSGGGGGGGGGYGGGNGGTSGSGEITNPDGTPRSDQVPAGGGGGGGGSGASYVAPSWTRPTPDGTGAGANGQVTISYPDPVTPATQLTNLKALVHGVGPGTSLADQIANAQAYLASGDTPDTCITLTGFIHTVQAQNSKTVNRTFAATLIGDATLVRNELHC